MSQSRSVRDRVVVYRLGSLGDTIVALPCLHAVERAFAGKERVLLTNFPVSSKAAPAEAVLAGSGLVHGFVSYPVGTRSFGALRDLRSTLRALQTDTLVYLTPSRGLWAALRDVVYFRLCGFRRIIGVPLTAALRTNQRGPDGFVERECERLARCVAVLGPIDLNDRRAWDLRLTPSERAAAAALFGEAADEPRIAINMGGKVVENDWGEANWSSLIGRIGAGLGDHTLVIVGAGEDAARAAKVGSAWPGRVVDLCGKVSARISAAAMSGSRLFIGHDSGPLHLASCVGVPCIGLFGNHDEPRKYHPYGTIHHVIHERRGVMLISVAQVEQAIAARLAVQGRTTAPATDERTIA